MSGHRRWFTAGGATAVLLGFVVTLAAPESPQSDEFGGIAALIALVGLGGALWLLTGDADGERVAPAPWSESGALLDRAPERSRSNSPLSGAALADVIEAAGETARSERSTEAGLAVVRPELRETLHTALVQGGEEREAVDAALADGSWTDDRVAAAVLEADLVPPDRSIRQRVNEWLFPERAVARRTRRAVQAVAEVSDGVLPAVVGQRAPRSVPVLPPTLENLQRAGDGTLSPAVDPRAVRRGPEPNTPEVGGDDPDETAKVDGEGEADAESTESTRESPSGDETVVGAR